MDIFKDNFPEARDINELNALHQQYPDLDPSFLSIAAAPQNQEFRNEVERYWQTYRPFADNDFITEIRKEFHARFWEMYLTVSLLENNHNVQPQNKTEGADVLIKNSDSKRVWIEATAAKQGTGADAVPDIKFCVVQSVPEDEMILRLTNAFSDKYETYQSYTDKQTITEDEPYVIAISKGQNASYPDAEVPLALKFLFGVHYLRIRKKKDGTKVTERTSRRALYKKNGAEVPIQHFLREEYRSISAVIYCDNTFPNHPDQAGSDLYLIHNPLATNPLPENFLGFGTEYMVDGEKFIYQDRNC